LFVDVTFVVSTGPPSAGLRWVLLVLQHQAHSRNRPTATDEKNVLYFGCNFSGWYNFRKIVKIKLKCTKFDFGWGSETPLGELTALPEIP